MKAWFCSSPKEGKGSVSETLMSLPVKMQNLKGKMRKHFGSALQGYILPSRAV